MFNQKDNRIDQSYTETYEHTAKTAQAFASLLMELLKKLNEKWQEHQENRKVAVKVDEETYNLVEDPDTPGAYKWEKVDLNKEPETSTGTQPTMADEFTEIDSTEWKSQPIQYSAEIEQPFTEYQAQTITTRLVSLLPENNTDYDYLTQPPTIQITATTESGETKLLYAQLENGEVVKNAFTEELSQEEIIDTSYEPLSQLLPPNSPLLLSPGKDNIENIQQNNNEENLATSAADMLSQIVESEPIKTPNNSGQLESDYGYTTDIEYSENTINNENLVENPPTQYDTDGLIIKSNIEKTQEPSNNESNTEIDEFTQIDEIPDIKLNENNQSPQYDADGLLLEENTTITVNPNPSVNGTDKLNNEIDEFSSLETYVDENSIELPKSSQSAQNENTNLDNKGILNNVYVRGVTAGYGTPEETKISDATRESIEEVLHDEIMDEAPIIGAKVVVGTAATQGLNAAATIAVGGVPGGVAGQIGTIVAGAVAGEVIVNKGIDKEQIDAEKGTITERVEAKVEEKLDGSRNINQGNNISNDAENNISPANSNNSSNQNNPAKFIAGLAANEVSVNTNKKTSSQINDELQEKTSLAIKKRSSEEQEEAPPPKKTTATQQEEPSSNYTYRTIASNPEVEPRAQQWARQSVIPVYEIKHRGEKTKVEYENNKNIALSATEMLKKYGTIETNGSRIYRSDAFTIRKQDGVVSIHRRGDEAKGFKQPLMEFKLNKDGTPDIKEGNLINNLQGKTTKHNLSPVEKQEFLIAAELINEKKGLPDLQKTDIREMGNSLGSLAPAGTLRTLQSFKETEVLGILNNTLNQAKKEKVTVGDFTIKRERDPDNENRASLILTKDSNDGRGQQTLVRFDLEKTENGVESQVTKMNISDYDINQIKEISQNAYKRNQNLEMNFGTTSQQTSTKTQVETNTRNLGQIAVDIHPWVQKEWVQMVDDLQENPPHTPEIEEGLQEIKERMDKTPGKATISDQCIMYDKIITHKTAVAQESNDPNATVSFMNKNDIIQDLKELRLTEINQEFSPTQNLTQKQEQTKRETQTKETPRPTPRTKKEELEV